MNANRQTTVVGVFQDQQHAREAVQDLRNAGFREDQIGLISHDVTSKSATATAGTNRPAKDTAAGTGAVAGAATGAGVGALWALGIAAGVLPAIGPVIAGGIFASILASAAGGAAAGGLIGALIGLGLPEEEAAYYEGEFKGGRTLVTVRAENRSDEARTIIRRHGGYDRQTAQQGMNTAGTTCNTQVQGETRRAAAYTGEAGQKLQVKEEELHARKQSVEAGEVRVRKEVHVEHKTLEVPVEREEVVIERRPVAGGKACSTDIREGEEIRIPVREEQVHVEKTPVVKEEVTVGKRKVQDTKTVTGTVRKEEVHVEQAGDVKVRGDKTPERGNPRR